jgi:cell division protein FtsI/penicillin-binding protein 2
VAGYYVAGKTGTAQVSGQNGTYSSGNYIHTFVGYAPVDNPRFVMIVKLDNPKGFNYAESTATPIFGELADFLLKYYQVPKSR